MRKIPQSKPVLYLSFDDGPSERCTPDVLKLLKEKKVTATFFLVAEKAKSQILLTQEIQRLGHRIGNHSLDHRYGIFFRGESKLRQWILQAESVFKSIGVHELVGFRPPAGIITPKLFAALKNLETPLILWNTRFYDSVWPWTQKKADKVLAKIESGSIILLHDVQSPKNFPVFLKTLDHFITVAQSRGFEFGVLPFPTDHRGSHKSR